MKLIPLRSEDLDFVAGLYRQTQEHHGESIVDVPLEVARDCVLPDQNTYFFVLLDDKGLPIGMGGVERIRWIDRVGEPVVALVPQARGKGIGKQLGESIVKVAREKLNLHRLQTYLTDGAMSVGLLKNQGFKREGVLEKARWKNGKWVDVEIYGKVL